MLGQSTGVELENEAPRKSNGVKAAGVIRRPCAATFVVTNFQHRHRFALSVTYTTHYTHFSIQTNTATMADVVSIALACSWRAEKADSMHRKSASRASRSPSARAPRLSTATARSPKPPSNMATSLAPSLTLPVRRSNPPPCKRTTTAHHTPQQNKESTR